MNDEVARAVEALRRGQLVALPTETVYGLGADAENADAVRRIFAAKGRPADHPVIVHLGSPSLLDRFARDVPDAARRLADRFWPGPLTLILPRGANVPDEVTGGHDTVGLRMPDHPLTLAVLRAFGGGVAAPSANRFGRLSPTTAEHVRAELGDRVDVILDGGPCRVGVESTIVALVGPRPLLLRPGAIRPAEIAEVIGEEPRQPGRDVEAPRAPGTLESHYAPATPLELVDEAAIEPRVTTLLARGITAAVLSRRAAPPSLSGIEWQRAPIDPDEYARELYARLRALDRPDVDRILVGRVPAGEAWLAIANRLQRAASRTSGD